MRFTDKWRWQEGLAVPSDSIGSAAGLAAQQGLKLITQLLAANLLWFWNTLHDVEAASAATGMMVRVRDKEGDGFPLWLVEAWHSHQVANASITEQCAPRVVRDYHPAT
jgi:hypothetical protein